LPFLATTKILMAEVRRGVGRETAHEVIREHAVATALEMREKGASGNDLFERLAADGRLGHGAEDLAELVSDPVSFTGAASAQVRAVVRKVEDIVARHPEAASYTPAPIL